MTLTPLTASWQDLSNGKTAPIVPGQTIKLGKSLTIRVDGDGGTCPAMMMTIVNAAGVIVARKLDTNLPWRAMADNAGLMLDPGSHVFTATPYSLDGKTALGTPLSVAFVVAGIAAAPTASISGTLFNDDDADGVLDANESATGARPVILADSQGGLLARFDADAAGKFTFTGLAAGTYRVARAAYPAGYKMSNNADGYLAVTLAAGQALVGVNIGTTASKPPVVNVPAPSPQPDTNVGNVPTSTGSHLVKGICTDALLSADQPIVRLDGSTTTFARMLGVWQSKVARLWLGVAPGAKPDAAWLDARIAWAKACGITRLIICCTPAKGGSVPPATADTFAYFVALARIIRGRGVEIVPEIVNEPNLADYWVSGDLVKLVALFVAPAIAALHAAGVETVGPSATGSVDTVRRLVDLGVDARAQGFHPYRQTADALRKMLDELAVVVPGKPLDLTEFNAFVGERLRAWIVQQAHPEADTRDEVVKYDARANTPSLSPDAITQIQREQWAQLRECPTVRHVCYYALIVDKETSTGPLALLKRDSDGTIRETPFSRDFWAVVA